MHDTADFYQLAANSGTTQLIGPNCPGLITPGKSNAGIIPADITSRRPDRPGRKSGTLTYQMMYELRDIGFSSAVGIGGDPVIGTTHIDALAAFEADPDTEAIVMIGEIGGDAEERAAAYIKDHVTKPVVGYVAGFTAPEGKTMGHAGAIVSGSSGTAQAKQEALEAAGVKVGKTPSETARLMREIISVRLSGDPRAHHDEGPGPGTGARRVRRRGDHAVVTVRDELLRQGGHLARPCRRPRGAATPGRRLVAGVQRLPGVLDELVDGDSVTVASRRRSRRAARCPAAPRPRPSVKVRSSLVRVLDEVVVVRRRAAVLLRGLVAVEEASRG